MPVLLGLDMGGTSVKAAIVSLEGGLIGSTNKQLNRSTGDTTPAKMVDLLVDCAQDVVSQSDLEWTNVAAIGLCTCAAVKDRDKGIIAGAANLDGDWTDFPLRSETEKKLELIAGCQIRIFLTTDFDAPALAETWIGAAKGHANSVHICIGTGIGVSFLENGHLIRGTNGIIEAGHIIVMPRGRQCGCGSRGCLEAYCAAPGIVEGVLSRMRAAFRDGSIDAGSSQEKALFDYFGLKSGTLPSCKDVFEAANYEPCSQNQIGTDLFRQICKQTVDEVCELLAIACLNFTRVMDPEILVLSGGVAEAGQTFVDAVNDYFKRHTWKASVLPTPQKIVLSTSGSSAGLIGAAFHAKQSLSL